MAPRSPATPKPPQPRLPRRRLPRPDRFFGPVVSACLLLLAFGAVAHASGSGWVQAIGAITAGLALVGMLGPAVLALGLHVECTFAPRDARRGEPLVVELVSNRSLRCTPAYPRGPAVVLPASAPTSVIVTPPHRGMLGEIHLRVATAAPLGLLWWSVDRVVTLPVTVAVAPGVASADVPVTESAGDEEGHGRPVLALSGDIRGVRPYRYGDSRRRVHWRATAHTGSLMVRETETLPDTPVTIVAELSDDPKRADEQAAEAMSAVAEALGAGKRVHLATRESGESVSGVVSDLCSAGRRLARAGVNPYAPSAPRAPKR
jgi:uncharacterized protein (DUF58 family)